MSTIASLAVEVGADIRPLTNGLRSASDSVKEFAKNMPGSIGTGYVSLVSSSLKRGGAIIKYWWKKFSADMGSNISEILVGVAGEIPIIGDLIGGIGVLFILGRKLKDLLISLPLGIGKAFGLLFRGIAAAIKLPFQAAGLILNLISKGIMGALMAVAMPSIFWGKVLKKVFDITMGIAKALYRAAASIPSIVKWIAGSLVTGIKSIPKVISYIIQLAFKLGEILVKAVLFPVKAVFAILTSSTMKTAITGITIGLAAVGTYLVYATKKGWSFIVATTKMADQIGMSTEGMVQLDYAAKLANVDIANVATSIRMMLRNVSQAAQKNTGKDIFSELGIDPRQLASMKPEAILLTMADAIAQVGNASDRARIAQGVFGRGWAEIMPLIMGGSDALLQAAQEANDLNLTFSRLDAEKVMQADNAINRMMESFKSTGRILAIAVAPYIEYIASSIVEFGKNSTLATDAFAVGLEYGGKAMGWLLDTTQVFVEAIKMIPTIVGAMSESFTGLGGKIWDAIGWMLPKGKGAASWIGGKLGGAFGGLLPDINIAESNKWSNRAADFFRDIRDEANASAKAVVDGMNPMNDAVTDLANNFEAAKERAKALADQAKQSFQTGKRGTIAINTPVNRAITESIMRAERFGKDPQRELLGENKRQTNWLQRIEQNTREPIAVAG